MFGRSPTRVGTIPSELRLVDLSQLIFVVSLSPAFYDRTFELLSIEAFYRVKTDTADQLHPTSPCTTRAPSS